MKLSLDTNVLVDVLRGVRTPVRRAFERALRDTDPPFASIDRRTRALLRRRAPRSAGGRNLRQVRTLLRQLAIEPFTDGDMRSAASVRAEFRRKGGSIGFHDALIAGQALVRGWTVVTNNTRDFCRVEGLEVVDWVEA